MQDTGFSIAKDNVFLLTIDVQEKLIPAMSGQERLQRGLTRMLNGAEIFGLKGCATEQYPKGLGATLPEYAEVLIKAGHPRYEKTRFNALVPDVLENIENSGCKKVLIIGVETHVCVFQTVRELINRGLEVLVVEDAVSSRFPEDKICGLEMMREMGAWITCSESVLFELLQDSKAPEFKDISKLVKD